MLDDLKEARSPSAKARAWAPHKMRTDVPPAFWAMVCEAVRESPYARKESKTIAFGIFQNLARDVALAMGVQWIDVILPLDRPAAN